jgi:hypothetical protein
LDEETDMEIIKLAPGVLADEDTDCIKINETTEGNYSLVASALMACGDGDNPESVALVASDPYHTYDAAEEAGLAWAEAHCVATIYVETGGSSEPVRTQAS